MTQAPETFRDAVAALQSVRPRPELSLEEIRAPQRLAPWSYALSCETTETTETAQTAGTAGTAGTIERARATEAVPATGRLVLLHDPEGQEAWQGVLRLVVYVRAELDRELASDPFLPAVGWSWLTDALESSGASWKALGGTVTETSSARFGDIAGPPRTDDLELRASWTPTTTDLRPHGEAFCQLLASVAGLPPVGVSVIEQRQT
ncbi:Protein of unknown function (DUF3000) [Prauserella shujinwangii]|uniref:DUF3000 family protein n=2 Tax=Prauserella shujinwangii TaxID=1453103 RepID=A0A2T0M3L8_9PSEU|nr:Protein of unknown function (DUF3000) [Prauserella shujinwangii]